MTVRSGGSRRAAAASSPSSRPRTSPRASAARRVGRADPSPTLRPAAGAVEGTGKPAAAATARADPVEPQFADDRLPAQVRDEFESRVRIGARRTGLSDDAEPEAGRSSGGPAPPGSKAREQARPRVGAGTKPDDGLRAEALLARRVDEFGRGVDAGGVPDRASERRAGRVDCCEPQLAGASASEDQERAHEPDAPKPEREAGEHDGQAAGERGHRAGDRDREPGDERAEPDLPAGAEDASRAPAPVPPASGRASRSRHQRPAQRREALLADPLDLLELVK